MQSKLVDAIALASSPIAVILTDEKPEAALQFKENGWGCVAATMLGVSKGKTAVLDRQTYGCPGGGVGLGFGNAYEQRCFAIDRLLSSGDPEAASAATVPAATWPRASASSRRPSSSSSGCAACRSPRFPPNTWS